MGGALALIAVLLTALPGAPSRGETLAGFRALEVVSTLTYASRPDLPHTLRATYAFPARARWAISAGKGELSGRALRYVERGQAFALDPGQSRSRALEGDDARAALAQVEMRLALILWPEAREWEGSGTVRRSPLLGSEFLRATLGASSSKVPLELAWCAADGKVIDAFREIVWRQDDSRAWPVSCELWHEGERIWSEKIEAIDTRLRVIDAFFVPPDRRELPTPARNGTEVPRAIDVPGAWVQRIELTASSTLEAALAADRHARDALKSDLLAEHSSLEETCSIEVDAAGAPRALLVRVRGERPGTGEWSWVAERVAWTLRIDDATSISGQALAKLRSALPSDARPGAIWLRLLTGKKSGGLLVLPLESAR